MEGVKTHMGIIDVFKGERNVIPKQGVKPFRVSQKQWRSSGDSRTNERRAEMERLTEWYDDGNHKGVMVKEERGEHVLKTLFDELDEGYLGMCELKAYEDTGLTPERIRELKERNTAKAPVDIDDEFDMYVCPSCNMAIGAMGDREEHKFCLNCGQRLRWEG